MSCSCAEDDGADWSAEVESEAVAAELVDELEAEEDGSQAVRDNAQMARSAERAMAKAERGILFIVSLSDVSSSKP